MASLVFQPGPNEVKPLVVSTAATPPQGSARRFLFFYWLLTCVHTSHRKLARAAPRSVVRHAAVVLQSYAVNCCLRRRLLTGYP